MHTLITLSLAVGLLTLSAAHAQDRIYRCGNEYTNIGSPQQAAARGCKAIEGGNVTIVQGTRPNGAPAAAPAAASQGGSRPAGTRVDSAEQRARDTDARNILESELRKAESRQGELLKEYNNGQPDKIGGEARNYQKYLDRVEELKTSIARNESDIAGIRRELDRLR